MDKIEWTVCFTDMNNIIGIGGQITIDGKKYRHAVELDINEHIQQAKYVIESKLGSMIKNGTN